MNTSFKRLLAGILCFCMAFSMLPTGLATGDEITDVGLTHTVTFFDWDNRIVDTQEVADGQNATPPPTPTRSDGYMFDQWYPPENLENVTTDRSVTAVYTKLTEFRITIQYEFKDHRMAAQPFVAVVQKGGTINETVPSPEVIGFIPDQESVTLNVSDCQKDETYTVVYTPDGETNYTVNHYLMGTDGQFPDTPSVTQTLNGEPGKMTEAVSLLEGENKENYKGYALFEGVAQARIAANGSTVVSIKYSRAKTQLVFDTGEDATAIAPVYNYFGAPFTVPKTLERAGYRFMGWYTDDANKAKTSLTDLPVFNGKAELPLLQGEGGADGVLTLHAKWQGKKVNYKIVYWVEKPNEIDPNGKTEEQLNEAYAVKTNFGYFAQKMCEGVAGNTLKPWEQDDNPTDEAGVEFITKSALDPANVLANNDPQQSQCKYYAFHHCDPEVTVKGDGTTEINVYLIRKVYTLTFNLGGMKKIRDVNSFPHGDFNYSFPTSTVEGDSYINGKTTYRDVTKIYKKDGKTLVWAETQRFDGYDWWGEKWSVIDGSGVLYSATTDGTGDLNTMTIQNADGVMGQPNVGTYTFLAKIEQDIDNLWPSGKNATFATASGDALGFTKWTTNVSNSAWVSHRPVLSSDLLPKNGDATIVVTHVAQYGDPNGKRVNYWLEMLDCEAVPKGETPGTANVDIAQYYYDGTPFTYNNKTYVRLNNKKTYVLSTVYSQDINLDAVLSAKDINGTNETGDSVIKRNTDRTYNFFYTRKAYTLSFNLNGATQYANDAKEKNNVKYEESLSGLIPDFNGKTHKGKTFGGWFTNQECMGARVDTVNPDGSITVTATMPNSDLVLYAKWVAKKYDVKFVDAESPSTEYFSYTGENAIEAGSSAQKPDDPTREGMRFMGWYADQACTQLYAFGTPVTAATTIYARWLSKSNAEYTVKYSCGAPGWTPIPEVKDVGVVGQTYTFEAPYVEGFFPDAVSKSVTIGASDNAVEFTYVPFTKGYYTVRYVDAEKAALLPARENIETTDQRVSANFVDIPGYHPDQYKIDLRLGSDATKNVITFTYTPNAKVRYTVKHYLQNLDGVGYTLDDTETFEDAVSAGATITGTPKTTYTGFTYNEEKSTATRAASSLQDNNVLHLRYDRDTYNVEFKVDDADHGALEGVTSYTGVRYESTWADAGIVAPTPKAKPGYKFKAWDVDLTDAAKEKITADVTYTAQFVRNDNEWYTVSYDANGGTGTMEPHTDVRHGTELTLRENSYRKENHDFNNWNTQADGTGDTYTGSIASVESSLTLYAQWTEHGKYTVTYSANGGTGDSVTEEKYVDTATTIKENTETKFTKEGYTFAGWNTAADGSGTAYAVGAAYNENHANVNLTLFAQWEEDSTKWVTVTYNANGGTGTMAETKMLKSTTNYVLAANAFTYEKHAFAGWNTQADGTGTKYTDGQAIPSFASMGATLELYAQWTATWTVTFYVDDVLQSDLTVTVNDGQTVTAPDVTAKQKTGHTLSGWMTTATGNTAFDFNTPITRDTSLRIKNVADKHTVTYKLATDGGVYAAHGDPVSIAYGEDVHILTTPTEKGYSFNCWYTDEARTTPATNTPMDTADMVFYGAKNTIKYTIAYQLVPAEGTTIPTSVTAPASTPFTVEYASIALAALPDVPTGYSIAGWYEDADCTQQAANAPTFDALVPELDSPTTITRYAKVSINKYTVTFTAGANGSLEGDTSFAGVPHGTAWDEAVNVPTTKPASDDYYFTGWFDASGNKVTAFPTSVTENLTYTAQFAQKVALTLTANSDDKPYNGKAQTITGYTKSPEIVSVDLLGITASASGTDVSADGYAMVWSGVADGDTLTGTDGVQYKVTLIPGKLTITPKEVDVKANNQERAYGAENPTLTYTWDGFENGETESVVTGTPELSTEATATSPFKTGGYPITVDVSGLSADNYTFTPVNGTLTVNPATLTVTAEGKTMEYGTTVPPLTYKITGYVNGEDETVVTGTPELSTTATADSPVDDYAITVGVGTLSADNYTFKMQPGKLNVYESGSLSVSAADVTEKYDGNAYGLGEPTLNVTAGTEVRYGLTADNCTLPASPTFTEAGAHTVYFKATNKNYTDAEGSATVTITKRQVTLTSAGGAWNYDGSEHMKNAQTDVRVASDGWIAGYTPTYTFDGTSKVKTAKQGEVENRFSCAYDTNNYDVRYVFGTLKINAITDAIVVKAADGSKEYDGTALTNGGYTFTENVLLSGDTLTATVDGSITDYAQNGAQNAVTKVVITNASGEDVTDNYTLGAHQSGTLKITKKAVEVTADSAKRAYNGEYLKASGYKITAGGFIGEEDFDAVSCSGAQLTKGKSANQLAGYTLKANTKEDNYSIKKIDGELEVTAATDPIIVTAADAEKTYDGKALTNASYTFTGKLFKEAKDSLSATMSADSTKTNVEGTVQNKIDSVKIMHGNIDVTDSYTFGTHVPGKLTVNPATLTVTADAKTRAYNETNPALTYTVKGFVNGETAATALTGTPVLSTTAGTATSGSYPITVTQGTLKALHDNYTFDFANATLTVTPYIPPTTDPTDPTDPGDSTTPDTPTDPTTPDTPTNADTPDTPDTPTNPTAPAPQTNPAPEPAPVDVVDIQPEPVPLAQPAPAPDAVDVTDIPAEPVPLAKKHTWALVNLICAGLSVILAAITLFVRHKEDEERDRSARYAAYEDETYKKRTQRHLITKVFGAVMALAGVVVFLVTELPLDNMVYTDRYTVLMAVMFAVHGLSALIGLRRHDKNDDDYDKDKRVKASA